MMKKTTLIQGALLFALAVYGAMAHTQTAQPTTNVTELVQSSSAKSD